MASASVSTYLLVFVRILLIIIFIPATTANYFPLQVIGSIGLAVLALLSLSYASNEKRTSAKKGDKRLVSRLNVTRTRILGILASACILLTTHYCPSTDPIAILRLRVLGFFNAAKILDLTVARAEDPPLRIQDQSPIPVQGKYRRAEYIGLLLSETRYHSFSIAIHEPGRENKPSRAWTYTALVLLPAATYVFPRCVEFYVLLGLLHIQVNLELVHSLLHSGCGRPMFWEPLASKSFGEFWRVRWHSSAASFLYTLGYRPARDVVAKRFGKDAGRAAGVLGAFYLSGIWHGWAAAAVSTTPWRTGAGAWGLFMAHGIACVVEGAVRKGKEAGWARRVVAWTVALWLAGVWVRDSLPRSNLPLVVWVGEMLEK